MRAGGYRYKMSIIAFQCGRREGAALSLRVVVLGDVLDKCAENGGILVLCGLAERDNVHRDAVLLELLREADHALLISSLVYQRRADEDDDALPQVLVLSVLEGKLCDGDGGGGVGGAADLA